MLKIGPNQESEHPKYDPCPSKKELTWLNQQIGIILRNTQRNQRSSKSQRETTQHEFKRIRITKSILDKHDAEFEEEQAEAVAHDHAEDDQDIDLTKVNRAKHRAQNNAYKKMVNKIRKRRKTT